MKRILVIGSGGSGKSTFARRLGALLDMPVIHLDAEHWSPGWVETPKEEWRERVKELVRGDAWIIDGNYSGTLDVRLDASDVVIFLDLPRTLCVWRALKRAVTFRNATRPDMAEGCREKFDLSFLWWIWNYPSRSRPKVLRRLEENARGKKVVRLRSRAEVEEFLSVSARSGGAEGVEKEGVGEEGVGAV
jgi:adenylate kinase family enzyme